MQWAITEAYIAASEEGTEGKRFQITSLYRELLYTYHSAGQKDLDDAFYSAGTHRRTGRFHAGKIRNTLAVFIRQSRKKRKIFLLG